MGEQMFFDGSFYLFHKLNNNLLVQVSAYVPDGLYIAAQKLKVNVLEHFFNRLVKTTHFTECIQFLEVELRKGSFSGKCVHFLSIYLFEDHIVRVVCLERGFSDFVVSVLACRAEGHDFWDSNVESFFLISKTVELTILIVLVSVFIVDFVSDPHRFAAIVMIIDLDNSTMIPATKRILTINQITLLESHPPLKIMGLALIQRNLKRMSIDRNGPFIDIIQILNLQITFIDIKYLAPAPYKLIVLAVWLDNIDKIVLIQSAGKCVVWDIFEVVVWLTLDKELRIVCSLVGCLSWNSISRRRGLLLKFSSGHDTSQLSRNIWRKDLDSWRGFCSTRSERSSF